jgi:hypothetical protein
MKNGFESGCNFFRLVFPSESDYPYNYAIARVFKDPEMFDRLNQVDINKYQKANAEAFTNTRDLRTEVRTEIYHNVLDLDHAD